MTISTAPHNETSPPTRSLAVTLYSVLFILLGVGALALLVVTIINDPLIQAVVNWSPTEESPEAPSLILTFLSQLGIVVPIVLMGMGIIFIRLGVRMLQAHIRDGYWAQIALLWLSVGAVVLAAINMLNVARTLAEQDTPAELVQFLPIMVPLLLFLPLLASWYWLNKNLHQFFGGQEPLFNQQARFAWNLLIPSLFIFVLVAARPLEQTFIRSLTDKQFGTAEVPHFVGADNYTALLRMRLDTVPCRIDEETNECATRRDGSIRWESIEREYLERGFRTAWTIPLPGGGDVRHALALSGLDEDFLQSLGTTLVFSVVSVVLELLIGLFMALVVNSNFRGRGLMRAVMLIPWAIPTVISARLWELILKDTSAGIVNKLLLDWHLIDTPQAWLSEPSLQLPAAIMVDVWKTSPFMALLLLAGLQTIPKDLYEAASVDGANPLRRFFSITLPLLRPTIAVALVFRMLDALRMFDLFNVLFGRQQLSMATYNYEVLVNTQQDGYASAISMIIFVIIAVFAFLYIRIINVETE